MGFTCACGHERSLFMGDMPAAWLDENGWSLNDEAIARLVCKACGRKGRPRGIIIRWDAGDVWTSSN